MVKPAVLPSDAITALKPQLLETFKISTDPNFEEKRWDRTLSESTRARLGALLRREDSMPGIGTAPNPVFLSRKVMAALRPMITSSTAPITLFAALSHLEGKIIARTGPTFSKAIENFASTRGAHIAECRQVDGTRLRLAWRDD